MNSRAGSKFRGAIVLMVVTVYLFSFSGSLWRNAAAQAISTDTSTGEVGGGEETFI